MRATDACDAPCRVGAGTVLNAGARMLRRKASYFTDGSERMIDALPSLLLLRDIHQLNHRQRNAPYLAAACGIGLIGFLVLLSDGLLVHLIQVEPDVRRVLVQLALNVPLGIPLG